jgi:hypothetical protein
MRIMLHAINYIYYISTCRVLLKGRTKDFETDMTTCVDNDNDSPILSPMASIIYIIFQHVVYF